jgi:hypothetical protein
MSAAPMYYRNARVRVLLLRANDLGFDAGITETPFYDLSRTLGSRV